MKLSRLALALEAHKRATGSYPDTLDAVAPFFPEGPPHDVATGQPYFYQKEKNGGFSLWGTGIDQKNDGGIRGGGRDLPWRPARKPQPESPAIRPRQSA